MTELQDTIPPTERQEGQTEGEAAAIARLATAAESLLFVAGRPLDYTELRKLLDVNDTRLLHVLDQLARQLDEHGRGIRLQRMGTQAQLVTAPENSRYIAALLGLPMTAKLTTAAMETLAVIAYRQPMTRAQIEAVRGVNSDRALLSLLQHGLVAEVGRAQTVGRPALFATTQEFLQQFGLTHLHELPYIEHELLAQQPGQSAQALPQAVQQEIPGIQENGHLVEAAEIRTQAESEPHEDEYRAQSADTLILETFESTENGQSVELSTAMLQQEGSKELPENGQSVQPEHEMLEQEVSKEVPTSGYIEQPAGEATPKKAPEWYELGGS